MNATSTSITRQARSAPARRRADKDFLHAVAKALEPAKAILIVGPGAAKLMRHLIRHDHSVADRVIGIETADHPTDRQILAYAQQYFVDADRLTPQCSFGRTPNAGRRPYCV